MLASHDQVSLNSVVLDLYRQCDMCFHNVTIDEYGFPNFVLCPTTRFPVTDGKSFFSTNQFSPEVVENLPVHSSDEVVLADAEGIHDTDEYVLDYGQCSRETLYNISNTKGVITVSNVDEIYRVAIVCGILITVPAGLTIHAEIDDIPGLRSCIDVIVYAEDSPYFSVRVDCYEGKFSLVHSIYNTLHLVISMENTGVKGSLLSRIHFKSLARSGRFNLPVVYTTSNTGYVVAGYVNGKSYSQNAYAIVTLVPPDDSHVFISFPVDEIGYDNCALRYDWDVMSTTCGGTVHLVNLTSLSVVRKLRCGRQETGRHLGMYPKGVLLFYESSARSQLGFKMIFSFLENARVSSVSQGRSANKFNCERAYDRLMPHVRCNVKVECADGMDERDCPYGYPPCNGSIGADGFCFSLVTSPTHVRWTDARATCRERGGDLVSVTTASRRAAISALFQHGRRRFHSFVGIQYTRLASPSRVYRYLWQWLDKAVLFNFNIKFSASSLLRVASSTESRCGILHPKTMQLEEYPCQSVRTSDIITDFICEVKAPSYSFTSELVASHFSYPRANFTESVVPTVVGCSEGEVTRVHLFCEEDSDCGVTQLPGQCHVPGRGVTGMFRCDNDKQHVHYTLTCDFHKDCDDGSDEEFCTLGSVCPERTCLNSQCVLFSQWCDATYHCIDLSDEMMCVGRNTTVTVEVLQPPAIVDFSKGELRYRPMSEVVTCPETHFQCTDGYCLPVFLRCNNFFDCPHHEDELNCDEFQCPGFYRCRASSMCLHPSHVCDTVVHCQLRDDEWRCSEDPHCPDGCQCQGLAFICSQTFPASSHPDLRYIDASQSGMALEEFGDNFFLVELRLVGCDLQNLSSVSLPNLQIINLSENKLKALDIDFFAGGMENLRVLSLKDNPIGSLFSSHTEIQHDQLQLVDLSRTKLQDIGADVFSTYPTLSTLNISSTPLHTIRTVLKPMSNLEILDLNDCPVRNFPSDVFQDLSRLRKIFTDNFKLCCEVALPRHFDTRNCFSPRSEVSSCEDLLRSTSYRVCLWIFAFLSIFGNSSCFLARLLSQKTNNKSSFNVFVLNLSIADLCMGVFLVIVGTADELYRGQYLWHSNQWTSSAACKIAGFLALVSSEVSALIICLITLDRFLALRFPFSRLHFGTKSSMTVSCMIWTFGVCVAALPLLPALSHWDFYGQTGICIPLPITRLSFRGHHYSFGIMIVLNFILFVLVASGQAVIFMSVRSNTIMSSDTTKTSQDVAIARRLISVAVSDFLCWFPIGLLGLLAYNGTAIPGEVNVAMAIFVLPLNAALNPFLYTFNMLKERRRKESERRMMQWLEQNSSTGSGSDVTKTTKADGSDETDALHGAISYLKARVSERAFSYAEIMDLLKTNNQEH